MKYMMVAIQHRAGEDHVHARGNTYDEARAVLEAHLHDRKDMISSVTTRQNFISGLLLFAWFDSDINLVWYESNGHIRWSYKAEEPATN